MAFLREEERLGAFRLFHHLGRTLRFVTDQKPLLGLCLLLSLGMAAIEMWLPLLVRRGIDRYILPPYSRIEIREDRDRTKLSVGKRMVVEASDGRHVFVRTLELSEGERAELVARKQVDPERFVLISGSGFPGGRFLSESDFKKLTPAERQRWRGDDVTGVAWLAALYLLLLLVNFGISFLATYGLNTLGQRAVLRVRERLWQHILRLPVRFFDGNPVGRLVTRVTNDTAALAELFSSVIATAVADVVLFVGILLVLFSLDSALAARLLLLAPPLFLLAWWFKVASQKIYRLIREQLAKLNTFLQESVSGIQVIKSFVRERLTLERFQEVNQGYYRIQMRLIRVFAIFRPFIDFFATVAVALLIWYAGGQVLRLEVSVGTLVAFLLYLKMLFMPLQDLAEKFNTLQSSVVASERIFKLLDTPAEPTGGAERGPDPRAGIEFENVSFEYEPGQPVLKGVSFGLAPGQTVALVGPTGAGKTTIASLLLGFYELPRESGRICVDGLELQNWDVHALRRRFSFVQQDLFLFSGSLGRNVALADLPDPARLARALSISRLDRVLARLPQGLDHPLNERGTTLSQGERQLVSFARALNHGGEVLILDEATSSVDSHTEALIQEALGDLLRGRTALIVAHRLSTVQAADCILVLSKGSIVERGTHGELLDQDGLYARLYRSQFETRLGAIE